jgi:hypothetical protein
MTKTTKPATSRRNKPSPIWMCEEVYAGEFPDAPLQPSAATRRRAKGRDRGARFGRSRASARIIPFSLNEAPVSADFLPRELSVRTLLFFAPPIDFFAPLRDARKPANLVTMAP